MPIEKGIYFNSDNHRLCGILHLPLDHHEQTPCIIGAHGLFSDASSQKQIALAKACNAKNMAYFRFDHRGCGRSEGDFKAETTITNRHRDFCNAVQTIQNNSDIGNNFGYFGSSMGGSIALLTGLSLPPRATVTLSTPISMNSVWEVLVKNNQDQQLSKDFYNEAMDFNILDQVSQINNILIFHGTNDEVVPKNNALKLHDAVGEPKELLLFADGCHQLSDEKHQAIFIEKAAEWFERYLF